MIQQCVFVYKSLNEQLPGEMCNLFDLNCNVHNYSTRSRELIHIPKHKKRIFQFNIRFTGPKFWNVLPDQIKKSLSVSSFKFKFKKDVLLLDVELLELVPVFL